MIDFTPALPYRSNSDFSFPFEDRVDENTTLEEIDAMVQASGTNQLSSLALNRVFNDDIAKCAPVLGACWVSRAAHGYELQLLLVRTTDKETYQYSYSDLSPQITTSVVDDGGSWLTHVEDLCTSDVLLHASNPVQSLNGMPQARSVHLMYQSKTGAGWLYCDGLLLGGEYKSTPLTRLLRDVLHLGDKVKLLP